MTLYEVLKTELADLAYAGMTDAEAAAAINAKTVTVTDQFVPLKWVKFVLQLRFNTPNDPTSGSKWDKVREASAGSNPVAKVFTDFYDDLRFDALDLLDPSVAYMLNLARSQIPGIDSADIDAVMAKAQRIERWNTYVLQMESVTDGDIASAKASVT